jgi:AcrR family transcriptional regulator
MYYIPGMSAPTLHAGRPRDARIDRAILDSALEVMLERGYLAASISEIARRAGVGTPAIYRRWPTKADIAMDVVVQVAEPQPIPNRGSIRDDLVAFMRQRIRMFRTPFFRQVLVPVLMEGLVSDAVQRQVTARFIDYRDPLRGRIRASVRAGQLRLDTDPDILLDHLMGTVAVPTLFSEELPVEKDAASIVDHVLEGYMRRPARSTARARR